MKLEIKSPLHIAFGIIVFCFTLFITLPMIPDIIKIYQMTKNAGGLIALGGLLGLFNSIGLMIISTGFNVRIPSEARNG